MLLLNCPSVHREHDKHVFLKLFSQPSSTVKIFNLIITRLFSLLV